MPNDLASRQKNSGCGYNRMLEHSPISATTFRIRRWESLRRHGIAPCARPQFRSYLDALARIDFSTVEVLTWKGPATYYVLFFIHLESRRVSLAGITRHPTEAWMTRWLAMQQINVRDISGNIPTFCTIETRSSATHSERYWRRASIYSDRVGTES